MESHLARGTTRNIARRVLGSAEFRETVSPLIGTLPKQAARLGQPDTARLNDAFRDMFADHHEDFDDDVTWTQVVSRLRDHIRSEVPMGRVAQWPSVIIVTPPRKPAVDSAQSDARHEVGSPPPQARKAGTSDAKADRERVPGPENDAEATPRFDDEFIITVFRLALGREAPESFVRDCRKQSDFLSLVSRIMQGYEFEQRVVGALEIGSALPHARWSQHVPQALRQEVAPHFEALGIDGEAMVQTSDWATFLLASFLHPKFWQKVAPSLSSEHRTLLQTKIDTARAVHEAQIDGKTIATCSLRLAPGGIAHVAVHGDAAGQGGTIKLRTLGTDRELCQSVLSTGERDAALTLEPDGLNGAFGLEVRFEANCGLAFGVTQRLTVSAGRLDRECGRIEQRMFKTHPAKLRDEFADLITQSFLSERPRVLYARVCAALLDDLSSARDAVAWIAEPTDATKLLDAVLELRAGGFERAAQLAGTVEPKDEADRLVTDFIASLGHLAREDARGSFKAVAAVLEPDDGLSADAVAVDTLSTDERAACAVLLTRLYVPPSRVVRLLEDKSDEVQKTLVGTYLSKLGPLQRIRAASALPPQMLSGEVIFRDVIAHLIACGRIDRAALYADKALYRFRDSREVRIVAAHAFRQRSNLADRKRATEIFAELYAAEPGSAAFSNYLGGLYADVIRRDPFYENEVGARCMQARVDAALRAVVRRPGSRRERMKLAECTMQAQMFAQCWDMLRDLVDEDPQDPAALKMALRCAEMLKQSQAQRDYALQAMGVIDDDMIAISYIKACREMGEPELVDALPDEVREGGGLSLRRELARNHFYLGDFEKAFEGFDALLEEFPDDLELNILCAATALERGDAERLARLVDGMKADSGSIFFVEIQLLRYGLHYLRGDYAEAVRSLNPVYANLGCRPLELMKLDDERRGGREDWTDRTLPERMFDHLTPGKPSKRRSTGDMLGPEPIYDGPLVSVVMTAYNATDYIETSIRSLMEQSYRNLELIVVDDCSTDGTPALLLELEKRHPKLRVILNTVNAGTYVAKNTGIMQAHGTYIALQDSDDWSHPDRIAKSVATLEARPNLMGLTTDWLRMTSDGEIVIKAGGQISHVCCISIVFRREPVLRRLGFYDSVRIAADMELIDRMMLVCGAGSFARLRWPLLFGRAHSGSLTADSEYGITRKGFTDTRVQFHDAYVDWHRRIAQDGVSSYMPFPLTERRYAAPPSILPNRVKAPAEPAPEPPVSKPARKTPGSKAGSSKPRSTRSTAKSPRKRTRKVDARPKDGGADR